MSYLRKRRERARNLLLKRRRVFDALFRRRFARQQNLGANTPKKRVNVGLSFDALTLVSSSLLLIFLFGYFDGRFTRTGEAAPPIVYLVYLFLGLTAIWQLMSLIVGVSHKNKLRD